MNGIKDLRGRVAVVTGGAAGIGAALAEALVAEGAAVVIADLPGDTLENTAARLGAYAVPTDVSDAAAVDALAARVMARHGRVDLLFNNAGVGLQQSLFRISETDWRWVFDVNLWGVVHGLRSFMPHLRAAPDGAWVVNTASLFSLYTAPGMAAYAASKWAVLGVTETLAREVEVAAERIGVTAFCPGPVETTIQGSVTRRDARYGAGAAPDPNDPVERAFLALGEIRQMPAAQAARIALDAVKDGRFWAITHPEYTQQIEPEHRALMEAIARQEAASA